jgi:hypothetical protein
VGLPDDRARALYNHGELHNLKIVRGTLNDEERFKIKEHIVQTIIMLSRLPFPRDLAGVEWPGHHETIDGRGYPRRLRADEMSVTARILAIADIFEALPPPTALSQRQPSTKPWRSWAGWPNSGSSTPTSSPASCRTRCGATRRRRALWADSRHRLVGFPTRTRRPKTAII